MKSTSLLFLISIMLVVLDHVRGYATDDQEKCTPNNYPCKTGPDCCELICCGGICCDPDLSEGKLLNSTKGEQRWTLQTTGGTLVTYTADGKGLFVADYGGIMKRYDTTEIKGGQPKRVWTFAVPEGYEDCRQSIESNPVLDAAEENVFVGTDAWCSHGGMVFRIDAITGETIWTFEEGGTSMERIVISNDGSVVYAVAETVEGSGDAVVYALDFEKGTLLWEYRIKGGTGYSNLAFFEDAIVNKDDVLLLSSMNLHVYGVDKNGKGVMDYSTEKVSRAKQSPYIAATDDFVYVQARDSAFAGLELSCIKLIDNGLSVVWSYYPESSEELNKQKIQTANGGTDNAHAGPAVVDDNNIFTYFNENELVALDNTGKPRWSRTAYRLSATPLISDKSLIFTSSEDYYSVTADVYGLSFDGGEMFHQTVSKSDSYLECKCFALADGPTAYCVFGADFHAYDAVSGEEIWHTDSMTASICLDDKRKGATFCNSGYHECWDYAP